jgi:type I restriction enzyme, S subunit
LTEWCEVALGELIEISHGFAFKGEYFRSDGPSVLLTPKNFKAQGGLDLRADRCRYYDGPVDERFVLHPGDVVVAMTDLKQDAPILGSAGTVPVSGRYLHNQRIGKVTVTDPSRLVPDFLPWLLNSPSVRAEVRATATGATVRHTAPTRIREVVATIPPLSIQKKLSAILGAVDELIEINERRIEVLEDLARSLYREWFVRFRFPGHEDLELAASELGPIPSGWAVRHLGDVCDRITDGAHASPRSTVLGKPMASVKDMTHLSLDLQTCRLISTEDFDRLSQQDCRPLVGDVLVSKDGAKYLDKVFEVMVENDVVVLSSIALLRPGHPIRSSVLASMLKNADTKARLKRSVSGAAIPRVVLKDFAAFKIVLPPMDLQDQFDFAGGLLIRVAARLEELNRALASIRDLLMPRLVSGRLDICDLAFGAFVRDEDPA